MRSAFLLSLGLAFALACGGGSSTPTADGGKEPAVAVRPSGPAQKGKAELKAKLCNGEDPKGMSESATLIEPYLGHPKGVLLWIHPENGGSQDEPTWVAKAEVATQAGMTAGNYLCNPATKCEGSLCTNEAKTGVLAFAEDAAGKVMLTGIFTTVDADASPEAKALGEAQRAKFDATLAADGG